MSLTANFCAIQVASLGLAILVLSLPSLVEVTAFSVVNSCPSTPCAVLLPGLHRISRHCSILRSSSDDNDDDETDQQPQRWPDSFAKDWLSLRLSMWIMGGLTMAATTGTAVPVLAAADFQEGISPVTKSALGISIRSTVVQSAKLVDAVDLKWERFSDSLRDQQKCDPRTNRRLFDNGIRSDGTPRGNPVLGALCEPVPLKVVDEGLYKLVLDQGLDSAAYETLGNNNIDRSTLRGMVDQTRDKLEPVFARAINDGNSVSQPTASAPSIDEAKKRQRYNLETFARIRAYSEAVSKTPPFLSSSSTPAATTKPQSKASFTREIGRKLELVWGRNLLEILAGPTSESYEFQSPFPKPDPDIPLPYDADQLANALGAIEKSLTKLQDGGLIGHWEISIPEDDYGEVVTIAVDDDVCLGAQILAREENSPLNGSPVVAMVRSALEDRAKIPYAALDVFFIDPNTTKNELYNPTQLLISLRNLGEEP